MKTISSILVIFLLSFSGLCGNNQTGENNNSVNNNIVTMETKDLLVNFILSHDETSKDSNSEAVKIKVSNEKLQLVKEYNGFKAPDDKSIEKGLSKDEVKLILDYVNKHQLNVNLKELKEKKGIGIEGYLKIEINQADTTILLIEGKTNIWGTDDYVIKNWGKEYVESRTNIENIKYFSKAKEFIRFIENL